MRQQIESIMREASRIMMEKAPRHIESKEGHANFVTEADRQTQEVLQERLLALLPGSVVFGEEKDNQPLTDAPTWVVDPIDGTLNYIHGLAHSAVSVAFLEGKKALQGYVFNPFRDEFFAAEAGKGAFLNGERIRVSDTPFERALVFYGSSPYKASLVDATFRAVSRLMKQTADIRRLGAAALDLAYMACGRADIFFEYSLAPWDYAAGQLLIEEAGGVFELLNPEVVTADFKQSAAVFTSNQPCAGPGLEIVKGIYEAWQTDTP